MKIKSIEYAGKEDVYNMEVDDTHDFVIQGGVVSHNCADETRYVFMSRPIAPTVAPIPDRYKDTPMSIFLDIPKEDIIAKPRKERMQIIGKEN